MLAFGPSPRDPGARGGWTVWKWAVLVTWGGELRREQGLTGPSCGPGGRGYVVLRGFHLQSTGPQEHQLPRAWVETEPGEAFGVVP